MTDALKLIVFERYINVNMGTMYITNNLSNRLGHSHKSRSRRSRPRSDRSRMHSPLSWGRSQMMWSSPSASVSVPISALVRGGGRCHASNVVRDPFHILIGCVLVSFAVAGIIIPSTVTRLERIRGMKGLVPRFWKW